jgi:hypothetical protein
VTWRHGLVNANLPARRLYSSLGGGRLDPSTETAASTAGLRYYWEGLSALAGVRCGRA